MTAAAAAAAAAADQSVIIILSDDDDDGGAAASTISYAPICFDELPDLEETPPNKGQRSRPSSLVLARHR